MRERKNGGNGGKSESFGAQFWYDGIEIKHKTNMQIIALYLFCKCIETGGLKQDESNGWNTGFSNTTTYTNPNKKKMKKKKKRKKNEKKNTIQLVRFA